MIDLFIVLLVHETEALQFLIIFDKIINCSLASASCEEILIPLGLYFCVGVPEDKISRTLRQNPKSN